MKGNTGLSRNLPLKLQLNNGKSSKLKRLRLAVTIEWDWTLWAWKDWAIWPTQRTLVARSQPCTMESQSEFLKLENDHFPSISEAFGNLESSSYKFNNFFNGSYEIQRLLSFSLLSFSGSTASELQCFTEKFISFRRLRNHCHCIELCLFTHDFENLTRCLIGSMRLQIGEWFASFKGIVSARDDVA